MYEGEGNPDQNFHKPIARDGEPDNFEKSTVTPEDAQQDLGHEIHISYDDPRVRALIDNEGLTTEQAIMRIKGEEAAKRSSAEE